MKMHDFKKKNRVWGIGMNKEEAMKTPAKFWQGENLLGRLLTKLRIDLIDEYARSCEDESN